MHCSLVSELVAYSFDTPFLIPLHPFKCLRKFNIDIEDIVKERGHKYIRVEIKLNEKRFAECFRLIRDNNNNMTAVPGESVDLYEDFFKHRPTSLEHNIHVQCLTHLRQFVIKDLKIYDFDAKFLNNDTRKDDEIISVEIKLF